MRSERTSPRALGWRRLVAVLAAMVILAAVSWQPALRAAAGFMAARRPLAPADAIVPLYGEYGAVAQGVADVYHGRLASRVLLYRTKPSRLARLGLVRPDHEVWHQLLQAYGVPPSAFEIMAPEIDTDITLGAALARRATASGNHRVIAVVASPFSRVRRNALRRGIDRSPVELTMHAVAVPHVDEHQWWRDRTGWLVYFDAYVLWSLGLLR